MTTISPRHFLALRPATVDSCPHGVAYLALDGTEGRSYPDSAELTQWVPDPMGGWRLVAALVSTEGRAA